MKTEETTYREGAELEQRICNTYADKFNGCSECPISQYCIDPSALRPGDIERKITIMESWKKASDDLSYDYDELCADHEDLKERYEKMLDKNVALMKENDELKSHLDFMRTNEMLKERKPDQRWRPIPLTTGSVPIEEQKVWYENSPGTNESYVCTVKSVNNERSEN